MDKVLLKNELPVSISVEEEFDCGGGDVLEEIEGREVVELDKIIYPKNNLIKNNLIKNILICFFKK